VAAYFDPQKMFLKNQEKYFIKPFLCNFLVRTLQYFQKDLKFFFAHKKLKKPPTKVAQKNKKSTFFPYYPELPKQPKQKNSCSKMWLIDQLYIELYLKISKWKKRDQE
jgi:hypothetical protein